MPKFIVTETVPCVQVWTYEVEAANQTEALEQVLNGEAEAIESYINDNYESTQYEIKDAEEAKS